MRQRILLLLTLVFPLLFASSASAGVEFDSTHAQWTGLLKEHLVGGDVNYGALKKDRAELDGYLAKLEKVAPAEFKAWTRDEQFAFWINAYNAYTARIIVDHYPIKSIRDIKVKGEDAWHQRFIPLQDLFPKLKGKKLTLNDIENNILRPTFKDPRIHAAVNCAAVSCPPLAPEAYTAKTLDRQLTVQTQAWLKDTNRNQFDAAKKKARISKIFEWYGDDFKLRGKGPAAWLAKNAPVEHRAWLASGKAKIEYLEYDWKLNDTKR